MPPQAFAPLLLVLSLSAGLMAGSCSGDAPPAGKSPAGLEKIRLKFDGRHGTRFLGFYVAEEGGFYAEEGLEVRLEETPEVAEIESIPIRIAAGEFDFAVGAEVLVEAQRAGIPVVVIAGIYQFGPHALFARADSGIVAPSDLAGKRVLVKSSSWRRWIEELLVSCGLTLDDIVEVRGASDLKPFLEGGVDVWAGFLPSEVPACREKGIDVVTLPLHEYGVTLAGDSLYTRRAYLESQPDLVRRFVRASLRGWRRAVEHPKEAVDEMLSSYPGLVGQRNYWQLSFHASIPLITPPGVEAGALDCDAWSRILDLPPTEDIDALCDGGFLSHRGPSRQAGR